MGIPRRADVNGSAGTAPLIGAPFPILQRLEVRQHLPKAPTITPVIGPVVKVLRETADPEHRVDARAAAEHATHGNRHGSTSDVGGRHRLEVPVERTSHVGKPHTGVDNFG